MEDIENHGNDLNLAYTFNGGSPYVSSPRACASSPAEGSRQIHGALRAGSVDMGRMTLQGALRFDRAWSYSPAQTIWSDQTSC